MAFRRLFVAGAASLLVSAPAWAAESAAGSAIDDSTLNARVNAALISDSTTKARQIDVEVSNGIVQLNGFVDSAAAKSRAEALAKGVEGVREVRNNLRVGAGDRQAGTVVDDGVITTKVKTALIGDDQTKAHQINVTTRNGVVQLSGFVDSAAAKMQAERIARQVNGVREVQNNLDVRGG